MDSVTPFRWGSAIAALVHLVLVSAAGAQDSAAAPGGDDATVRAARKAEVRAPGRVPGDIKFLQLSSGGAHACGLAADSTAYCWGSNEHGQLGDSTTVDRAAPTPVSGGRKFQVISAGRYHTCAITPDFLGVCWGRNEYGQGGFGGTKSSTFPLEVITRAVLEMVSAGGDHTCATSPRGDGYCWGRGEDGQLGNSADENITVPIETWGRRGYREMRAGGRHTCTLWHQTRVVCWGANERGQLGNASRTPSRVAMDIRMSPKTAFVSLALGDSHSCGLTDAGAVYCWGDNTDGQLGTDKGGKMDVSPREVKGGLQFTSLSASENTTCGALANREIYCWGSNADDQFGGGPATGSRHPVRAAQAYPVTSVQVGGNYACGLDAAGNAYCWGKGMKGMHEPTGAGVGTPHPTSAPPPDPGLTE